ncbi:MAG: dTMP kinase [Polaribacter sp.]
MQNKSLFIVIEGLDGSGKTTVGRQLAHFLQTVLHKKVKLSFEPHDASCGGLFIRQVLEKKITTFSHETLALAFAANRRDHGDRVVNQWLNKGEDKILICDRYYLSSLVYQSNDNFSMEDVMRLNSNARKPDLIFFMNVRNEVVLQRMDTRNKPKELFEENMTQTREKFLKGVSFLKEKRNETIFEIDANGTISSVLKQMAKVIYHFDPAFQDERLLLIDSHPLQQPFDFSIDEALTTAKALLQNHKSNDGLKKRMSTLFSKLSFSEKGAIFLSYLSNLGYDLGDQIPGTTLTIFGLTHQLPGGLMQRGAALVINEEQRYDAILSSLNDVDQLLDFLFVFSPGSGDAVTKYFERETIVGKDGMRRLFPNVKIVTELDLKK